MGANVNYYRDRGPAYLRHGMIMTLVLKAAEKIGYIGKIDDFASTCINISRRFSLICNY